jgi:hypothetical protein
VAISLDRALLTSRHLAVIGVMQRSPGPVSATTIAAELRFEVAEVVRLLVEILEFGEGGVG